MTQQKQLFGYNKPIVNVNKLDPTDILDAEDLFFIQKLMKLNIKTDEILNKFECQDRQFVLDYIERLKREAKEGKWKNTSISEEHKNFMKVNYLMYL